MGCVEHARLSVDLDVGNRLEKGDHRVLRLFVALGGGGLKGGADLCMAKVVWLSASAGVVAAEAKGVCDDGAQRRPVGSRGRRLWTKGSLRGRVGRGGKRSRASILDDEERGMQEGGVAFFEDFGASGALAGEGSVLVEESEVEDGGEEAISGLDCGRSCVKSDFVKREDAEASESGREGDDLGVGVEGARGGAKDKEGVLELSIDLFPAARQVVRLKAALEMA
jgi:hypothetical protein